MELIVVIMVFSIYTGAIAAPLALFILARRTGHGPLWLVPVGICSVLIWVAIIMGFLSEFLDVAISGHVLEIAGVAAVVAFAVLAVLGLVMVTKAWPDRAARTDTPFHTGRFGAMVTDIE